MLLEDSPQWRVSEDRDDLVGHIVDIPEIDFQDVREDFRDT